MDFSFIGLAIFVDFSFGPVPPLIMLRTCLTSHFAIWDFSSKHKYGHLRHPQTMWPNATQLKAEALGDTWSFPLCTWLTNRGLFITSFWSLQGKYVVTHQWFVQMDFWVYLLCNNEVRMVPNKNRVRFFLPFNSVKSPVVGGGDRCHFPLILTRDA